MNGLTRRLIAGAQMANAAGRPVVAKARYPYLADRASASLALLYGGSR